MNVKSVLLVVVCTCLPLYLTGCNTWEGFGKDMEKAGEEIQESIGEAKD